MGINFAKRFARRQYMKRLSLQNRTSTGPPRWANHLLEWVVAPHLLEEVQGDLHERYNRDVQMAGVPNANRRYWLNVLRFVRPFAIKRKPSDYSSPFLLNPDMLRNYFKIAFRNLVKNKVYSFINIAGLATGMAVAMLIGLWLWDELSFNKYHQNYDRIAQVMQSQTFNGDIQTWPSMPYVMGNALSDKYGDDFKHVVTTTWIGGHILTTGDKQFMKSGSYMSAGAPDMLTLKMLKGTRAGLKDPSSILISKSVANAFFGDADPVGKLMKIDNKVDAKVTGVYEDLPYNSQFRDLAFIAPWELNLIAEPWIKQMENPWGMNGFPTFVQLADNADLENVSAKTKTVKADNVAKDEARFKPEVFLHPMRDWHLYSEFKNGVNIGGRIESVWLFGIIGVFVLLLACINFMNLSTARSEKRAKEVGIRKVVGSIRSQLISQFFSESLLVVAIAFVLCLLLVQLILPAFNQVADKEMSILWSNPWFWLAGVGFSLLTGLIAGSYPALFLSSFQPIKVLKGTFRVGRFAAIPRKVLVVLQFTVSVTLIIGTIIVFRQVQHAQNRPVGYNRESLVTFNLTTKEVHKHFDAFRDELKKSGVVAEVAESEGPLTQVWSTNGNFNWKGKDPNMAVDFPNTGVSPEFGKTVGWKFKEGRDFSRDFSTDSSAFVINEAAAKFMGFKNPVGEIIDWEGHPFIIIGVIKDMVVESPYQPVRPSLYCTRKNHDAVVVARINPTVPTREALATIELTYKRYSPNAPFDYKFVDDEYAKKFGDEQRIGKLASFFAVLAIFISCLGIFGLASFMAEQRTKEIGVRKVLGASVMNLWRLLSKDFVFLVFISLFIATPIAYYFLSGWLEKYQYRTDISWWVFVIAGAGALLITLLTVSYQAIKAALMNPVKSLRSE